MEGVVDRRWAIIARRLVNTGPCEREERRKAGGLWGGKLKGGYWRTATRSGKWAGRTNYARLPEDGYKRTATRGRADQGSGRGGLTTLGRQMLAKECGHLKFKRFILEN
jgi:hypothetical protein